MAQPSFSTYEMQHSGWKNTSYISIYARRAAFLFSKSFLGMRHILTQYTCNMWNFKKNSQIKNQISWLNRSFKPCLSLIQAIFLWRCFGLELKMAPPSFSTYVEQHGGWKNTSYISIYARRCCPFSSILFLDMRIERRERGRSSNKRTICETLWKKIPHSSTSDNLWFQLHFLFRVPRRLSSQ